MSSDTVAIIGFVALFALMLLRVPVGMAMGLVGVSGFAYIVGGTAALKNVGLTSMRTVTDYTFGVIPMFLLMGAFVSNSGMSRELFRAADAFVGHFKGGLGIATIAACAGFAAISGSSVATAATFATVAYPEMRRYNYPQSFATGVIGTERAAGGDDAALELAPAFRHQLHADANAEKRAGTRDRRLVQRHFETGYRRKTASAIGEGADAG